jgi:hypothetical protein
VDAQVALEHRRGTRDRAMSETEKTEKKIVRGKNGGWPALLRFTRGITKTADPARAIHCRVES